MENKLEYGFEPYNADGNLTYAGHMMSLMVSVSLTNEDDFLKIVETLTRIGMPSHKAKTLSQSCHIYHKNGKYYIAHFKELFRLSGRESVITDEDIGRRNRIALMLEEWGLLRINDIHSVAVTVPKKKIMVIKHSDKKNWNLVSKFYMRNLVK